MQNQLAFKTYGREKYRFNILEVSYLFLSGYLFFLITKALHGKKMEVSVSKRYFQCKRQYWNARKEKDEL